ncbi:ABC transporter permease [Gorillibacterium timonense]|uniref:ABC transporter permease n=1 Tax=Gorillibacterium timonense TaxID=1689269 RepID=UPI00071E0522|nr:ABC transporter permease [Gorillibacterium timonense]
MVSLYPLVKNETIKMLRKRRFQVIVLIVAALIPIFVYAQVKVTENSRKQLGDADWRIRAEKRISDMSNTMNSNIPEDWKVYRKVEIQRLQYSLERNVDPESPNSVTFTSTFIRNSIGLFLPLLVAVIASDIVSSEQSTGTIKLLLTRPVRRWKILMSKLLTLVLFVSLIVVTTAILTYLISGLAFGYGGWQAPVLTGFQVSGDQLDTSHVQIVEQWRFLLMELGLAWFSCLVVACLSLMISVLVRSTAAGMGIMLAVLIAGMILTNMVSSWESAKYLFMINLDTISFLAGSIPPVPGLSLDFSLTVLAIWALASLVVSFGVFTRRDVLG